MKKDVKSKWFVNQVLDILSKNPFLTPGCQRLLIELCKYADKKGICWPLTKSLEKKTGISRRSIFNYLKILKHHKIIKITKKFDRSMHMTRSTYHINIDAIIALTLNENMEVIDQKIIVKEDKKDLYNNSTECNGCTSPKCKCCTRTLYIEKPKKQQTNKANKDIVQIDHNSHFEDFWATYPRKEGKIKAREIWTRERLDSKANEIIADVRERQVRHDRWEDRSYIPLPVTYLRNQGWTDEIVERRKHEIQNGKFNSATYLFEEVKKDELKQRESEKGIFNFSDHLVKKVD